jgi:hypothetical protein
MSKISVHNDYILVSRIEKKRAANASPFAGQMISATQGLVEAAHDSSLLGKEIVYGDGPVQVILVNGKNLLAMKSSNIIVVFEEVANGEEGSGL